MIQLIKGNITQDVRADVIINAANEQLANGGGVCGAIHVAAGPHLELYNQKYNDGECQTGHAKISPSFDLYHRTGAGYIIHTVGPDVREPCYQYMPRRPGASRLEEPNEAAKTALRSCYASSLTLAIRYGLKSVAFPSISTGIFSYPVEKAASVAIETVTSFLLQRDLYVTFCLFSDSDLEVYRKVLNKA